MRIRQRARRLKLRLPPRTGAQKLAGRSVDLWNAIERGHDPDLIAMRDERDMLKMNYECTREVQSEWAATARLIAPESKGCDCDVCAIGRALDQAVSVPRTESGGMAASAVTGGDNGPTTEVAA